MRVLAATLLLAASTLAVLAARPRDDAWREDFAFFAREFAEKHVDFAKLYPKDRFTTDLDKLTRAIARSSDADLTLGLMRIVASAHVGHTYVRFPTDGPLAFHRLPLGLQWVSDGLAVTAATEPYRDAVGLRVVSIGTMTAEQIEAAVAPYVSYEHDAWLRLQTQSLLLSEEVLRAVGQLEPDGTAILTLERPDGTTRTMRITPVPWTDQTPLISIVQAYDLPAGPARVGANRNYRYEILAPQRTLYVRYNKCAEDPQQPFADFTRTLFADVDGRTGAIDRTVIDLRANGGGDSRVIQPLLAGLRARRPLAGRGHLYALVGPATFSSGLLAAASLKNMRAVLIGETPGELLNSYGEVRQFNLPNSRLLVQYSTKFFTLSKGGKTLEPDVKVTRSLEDLRRGRDPVLERALK